MEGAGICIRVPVLFFAAETTFNFALGVFCADKADSEVAAIFSTGKMVSSFSRATHSVNTAVGSSQAIISG